MASLSDEIQACVLRSFCPPHSMSFERFHTKFPQLKASLENPESDTSVLLWFFPLFPHTIDSERWRKLDKYVKSEEGQEYRPYLRHCARYAKLCLENCKYYYKKANGTLEEKYEVDRAFSISGCDGSEERDKMKKKYPEDYGQYLLRGARKRRRLVDDVEIFQIAPEESQGST